MDDYRRAPLDAAVRLLCDYAVLVTTNVHAAGEAEIAGLREAGWSEAAILEAVEIVGFFNYYNRLVDALGVESEPEWAAEEVNARPAEIPGPRTSRPAPPRQVRRASGPARSRRPSGNRP